MKISAFARKLIIASSLAILFVLVATITISAQKTPPPVGQRGGVRGGGSPVEVVVKMNDAPIAGITVTFKGPTNSATGTTDSNGVVTINLVPGQYTVSASNDSGSGSKVVNVKESTTTLIVGLTLAPKTP